MMFDWSWIQSPWALWFAALVIGFPLLAIVLGEVLFSLESRSHPAAETIRILRNLVLPLLVAFLVLRYVWQFSAKESVTRILATLMWIGVIHAILSLLNVSLFGSAKGHSWRARTPKLFIDLLRAFLVLVGTAIVLSTVWKTDLKGLIAALGVGSIVIGLALQNTLGNVMSGIALLFERPFRVGDWLHIGSTEGRVIEMNWRAVHIETRDKMTVVVPNSVLSRDQIKNLSRPRGLYYEELKLGFSYDSPPNVVKEILLQTALQTPGVMKEPSPVVFTLSYDDSQITYKVRIPLADVATLPKIRDDFMSRIWYVAKRHELDIPFPVRTLHHHGVEGGPVVPSTSLASQMPNPQGGGGSTWSAMSAEHSQSLQAVPAFLPLKREDFSLLLSHAKMSTYGAREPLILQGEEPRGFYVLLKGEAVMEVADDQGVRHSLGTLRAGDFFGETALLYSSPHLVDIFALSDVEVMIVEPDDLKRLLQRSPVLARELAQSIETRKRQIARALEQDEAA